MSYIKVLLIVVIVAALAAGGYYFWKSRQNKGPGPGFASGNGRLEATEVDISTKLAGRIDEIRVDEGDYVRAGDILAVMQTDVLEAQLNEARAQVANAITAEASARAQVAVRQADVGAAEATVQQRRSELDQYQRRLRRSSVLSEEGVITGQQFDDDETTEAAAKAAVDTALAQVAVAQAGVQAAEAEAKGAVASIHAAEASAASIEADIKDSHLAAPRDGRIQYRIVQPGEVVAAGGRVLNLVDLSDVYMTFFLPANEAGRIGINSEARIVLDAYPQQPLPAVITFVASTAQFTPKTVETEDERQKLMFRVKAKVDPEFLHQRLDQVKTGLPGVAWVRVDPNVEWPEELAVRRPGQPAATAAPLQQGQMVRVVQPVATQAGQFVQPLQPIASTPQAIAPVQPVPTVQTVEPAVQPARPVGPRQPVQPLTQPVPTAPLVEVQPAQPTAPATPPADTPQASAPNAELYPYQPPPLPRAYQPDWSQNWQALQAGATIPAGAAPASYQTVPSERLDSYDKYFQQPRGLQTAADPVSANQ